MWKFQCATLSTLPWQITRIIYFFKCPWNVSLPLLLQRTPLNKPQLQMAQKAIFLIQACSVSCGQLNLRPNADLKQTSTDDGPRPNLAQCLLLYTARTEDLNFFFFAFSNVWEKLKRIFCDMWKFCEIQSLSAYNETWLKYSHVCFCIVSGCFWVIKPEMFTVWCFAEKDLSLLLQGTEATSPGVSCETPNLRPGTRTTDLESAF